MKNQKSYIRQRKLRKGKNEENGKIEIRSETNTNKEVMWLVCVPDLASGVLMDIVQRRFT